MRDNRRGEIYFAEKMAFDGTTLWDVPDDIEAVAREILDSYWWKSFGINVDLEVGMKGSCSYYRHSDRKVYLLKDAGLSTVAHELAHALDHFGGNYTVGHSPTWRGWFLYAVGSIHGDSAEARLCDAFRANRMEILFPTIPRPPVPVLHWREVPVRGGWNPKKDLTPSRGPISL